MQPVIFALETKKNMQTHENGHVRLIEIDNYIDWPDSVLLDIDASFVLKSNTIDKEMPQFPREIEMLKSLNRIRNRNLDNYDKIYPSNNISNNIYDLDNFNVETIRAIFFDELTPFLVSAYQAIDIGQKEPRNVNDFFVKDLFFDNLKDQFTDIDQYGIQKFERAKNFAEVLIESRSFSHFMDGYIHDDIMNFDLTNSILCHRGLLARRYKSPQVTLKPFQDQIKQKLQTLNQSQIENLKQELLAKQHSQFVDQQVSFYYRLPSIKQRIMLFEKILLMVERRVEKKQRTVMSEPSGRKNRDKPQKSNKHLDEFYEFKSMKKCYPRIVQLINQTYKQLQENKLDQNNMEQDKSPVIEIEKIYNQNLKQVTIEKSAADKREKFKMNTSPTFRADSQNKYQKEFDIQQIAIDTRFSGEDESINRASGKWGEGKQYSDNQSIANTNKQPQTLQRKRTISDNKSNAISNFQPQALQKIEERQFISESEVILESQDLNSKQNDNQMIIQYQTLNNQFKGSLAGQLTIDQGLTEEQKKIFKIQGTRESGLSSFTQSANFGHKSVNNQQLDKELTLNGKKIIEELKDSQMVSNSNDFDAKMKQASQELRTLSVMNIAQVKAIGCDMAVSKQSSIESKFNNNQNVFKLNLKQTEAIPELKFDDTPKQMKDQHLNVMNKSSQSIIEDDTASNFTGYGYVPFKQFGNSPHKNTLTLKHKLARIQQSQKKQDQNSIKAMYGRKGFLNFLQNLFVFMQDKDKHQINFYFTIRDKIIDHCDRLTANQVDQHQLEQEKLFNNMLPISPDQSLIGHNPIIDPRISEFPSGKFGLRRTNNLCKLMQRFYQSGEDDQGLTYSNNIVKPQVKRHMSNLKQVVKEMKLNIEDPARQIRSTQQISPLPQEKQPPTTLSLPFDQFNGFKDLRKNSPRGFSSKNSSIKKNEKSEKISQKQDENESSDDEEQDWFEIDKTPVNNNNTLDNQFEQKNQSGKESISSQSLSDHQKTQQAIQQTDEFLTYQEIMIFMKWIDVFEDRKYSGQMLLWLLLQFPITNAGTLKFINRQSKMNLNPQYQQALVQYRDAQINTYSSSDTEISSDDEINNQTYHYIEILDYLFPYKTFQMILDNLSNFQVIDLYNKMSEQAKVNLRKQSVIYDITLTQIEKEQIWNLPKFSKDLSKEVLHLVIKAKFDEALDYLKNVSNHYENLCEKLVLSEQILKQGNPSNIESFEFKQAKGKREKMKNSYFETIDERIFQECSLLRFTLQQEYKKIFEDEEQKKEEQQLINQPKTPSKGKDMTGFFQQLNNEPKLTFGQTHRSSSTSKAPIKKKGLFSIFKRKNTDNSNNNDLVKNKSLPITNKKHKRNQSDLNFIEQRPQTENQNCFEFEENKLQDAEPDNFQKAQQQYQNQRFQGRLSRDPGFQSKLKKIHELHKISLQLSRLGGPVEKSIDLRNNSIFQSRKKLKTPILASVKLLTCVIQFWTKKENYNLLNKREVMDGNASNAKLKQERILNLQTQVLRQLRKYENIEPTFLPQNENEILPFPMTTEQYIESSKQCFYLNIFNALILLKITEICVMKPTKVFGLKNYNSWVALMHNTSIVIGGNVYTAYQIKHDIIKNVNKRSKSNYCVDHHYVHPLIEYAFFLPFQGNLRLNQLCFTNVAHLSYQLARNINQKLRNTIKVKEDFKIIMLPSSLKNCFSCSDLKINFDDEQPNQQHVHKILDFIYAQIIMLGQKDSNKQSGAREWSQVYKVLNKLRSSESRSSIQSQSQKRDLSGQSQFDILEYRENQSTLNENKFNSQYLIEFVDQDHNLKGSKILGGLTQYYNDVLREQLKKKTEYQ